MNNTAKPEIRSCPSARKDVRTCYSVSKVVNVPLKLLELSSAEWTLTPASVIPSLTPRGPRFKKTHEPEAPYLLQGMLCFYLKYFTARLNNLLSRNERHVFMFRSLSVIHFSTVCEPCGRGRVFLWKGAL